MTEQLKHALHEQASDPHFAPVDLDALFAAGDRRVRRRRWGVIAAGAAAAVAVVALAPGLVAGEDTATDPAGPSGGADTPVVTGDLPRDMFARGRVTWAWDSVLHYGDVTVDVGRDVDAFVRTSIGFVYASDGEVWQVDGDTQHRVGDVDADNPRLVSDDEGPLAGWVDASGEKPAFVVLDQETGATEVHDEFTRPGMGLLADEEDPAYFYGLDAHTAYWRDTRGAVATDLDTGEATVVDAGARNGFDLVDVEDNLLALSTEDGTDFRTATGGILMSARSFYGSTGAFSPSARYYSGDADEPQVYDVAAGRRVSIDLGEYAFGTGYDWIDGDTLVVIAARTGDGPLQLLTCEMTTGACTSYADDLGSFEDAAGHFQLPVGETIQGD